MEWKAVDSSQIAEVGHDPETETLGIRFKPTKKQQAEQPTMAYTEYHYANVDKLLYESIVNAESVGKSFAQYIKDYPSKYPFIRVA